jgi:hypothetical protein
MAFAEYSKVSKDATRSCPARALYRRPSVRQLSCLSHECTQDAKLGESVSVSVSVGEE